MESASVFRSFHCSTGIVAHMQCSREKPGVLPMCNATSNKSAITQGLNGGGRLISSKLNRKRVFPCLKASDTTLAATSDVISSDVSSDVPLEKQNIQSGAFPNGFEELVLGVCDETDVAELKIKVGNFEMNLRRNIATQVPASVVSQSTPPPVASKPSVESPPTPPSPLPSKPSAETTSPYQKASLPKLPKLVALEASGATGYVLVLSPTVGSFRRNRTIKGKKQPPIFKEGDMIKEGQVIGYVDQFGSELPVKSDVAGEVLKLLHNDGGAIGYGDPLIAVLPLFHGTT